MEVWTHLTGSNVGFALYGDLLELDDDAGEGWKRLKQGLKGKSRLFLYISN